MPDVVRHSTHRPNSNEDLALKPTMTLVIRRIIALCAVSLLVLGCERKPEDLEKWRNAEGGMEKMQQWAKSSEEPLPVRKRAVQILVEEGESNELPALLDDVKDEQVRAELVGAVIPAIEKMWAKQDFPTQKEVEESGGRLKVGASKAVQAVDAAYFLQPYATGEGKQKLEAILADWISKDHELRDQLSQRTTLGQILPRAGDKGFEGMMTWFASTQKPSIVARTIRKYADDATKDKFAKVVMERANKEHPDLSKQMQVVIVETNSKELLPYLERIIKDESSPGPLADAAMDAYVRIQGPLATGFLGELVKNRQDRMRSTAFTRLLELRGEPGLLQAVNALPLETDAYPTEGRYTLENDSKYYCNIAESELKKQGVEDIKPIMERMLKMNRWPAQVIALRCVETNKWSDLKPQVAELEESDQPVPGWGEEGTTVGDIAEDVGETL